jgi:hypothetical protein
VYSEYGAKLSWDVILNAPFFSTSDFSVPHRVRRALQESKVNRQEPNPGNTERA